MINGNPHDFLDKLTYEDHYAIYKGKKYFFNGCQVEKDLNDKIVRVSLEVYNLTEDLTVYSVHKRSVMECILDFESAKIWNGKSFWDIESEIEWVDE